MVDIGGTVVCLGTHKSSSMVDIGGTGVCLGLGTRKSSSVVDMGRQWCV